MEQNILTPTLKPTLWQRVVKFMMNPRNIFILGGIIIFILTLLEVTRDRHSNFKIFALATQMFWDGVAPYGDNWNAAKDNLDYFLYGPLFNLLFAPFAFAPKWLGPMLWNISSYILWFAAIFTLPRFTTEEKCKSFLFTFLLLATTQLSFQYNVAIGAMFLLIYNTLERGKSFWAVVLILISGFTKIYGFFAIGLLFCYPQKQWWRYIAYAIPVAAIILLAPAASIPLSEVPAYYQEWISALTSHKDTRTWMTVFYMKPFDLMPYQIYIQIGVLVALFAGLLSNIHYRNTPYYRIGAFAVLVGYVIMFSNSSEGHTYVISLIGYMMWYWAMRRVGAVTLFDKVLFWLLFVVVAVMPVDVLCPPKVMRLFYDATINLWLITAMWTRICYTTFARIPKPCLNFK